ncbi:hypothetical protein SAMN04244553_2855 [Nocardia amikacinitolerans]|uniref:Uncharacterized protein n=1 Tax=Nocardia amikacinitolerans TaxID=756689 RepID=A0A285LB61_9NOCA|nr:hypothetical protein [Nocardia amikacinitolerans]MCP2277612.1 hypothetical protein [Nocardia amikacinitolerans]MCP2299004.1 hypothetical protein [Nocardia amikacinitolerans]MCP2320639.1 hypothetical protein [Nocardia amikacinitolerans]SNY81267.1 hypothetical protein SAMN04244553_2855 [Nocardia amikacinitolerans]
MRFTLVSTAALAVFTTATAVFGAGTAAAAVPVADQGRVGVRLSHEETVALAGGPVPAVVTMFVPLDRIGAGLHKDTEIQRDQNGGVHASLRQVIAETARHPDGTVTMYVNAPGTRNGRILDVYQNWTN